MNDILERLKNPMLIHSHVSVAATTELDDEQTRKDLADAAEEIERLRAAIFWALGEDKDADGKWFGEAVPEGDKLPPYWWRKNLRKLAGLASYSYDKERRTLTRDPEQSARGED